MASARQADRRLNARTTPFARALTQWLKRFGTSQARKAAANPKRYVASVEKQDSEKDMRDELRRLILRFGLRHGIDSTKLGASMAGGRAIIPGSIIEDAIAGRPLVFRALEDWAKQSADKADGIIAETKAQIATEIRRILDDAAKKGHSTSVVARDVRASMTGEGRLPALSFERATAIARTELGSVENAGIVAGFEETGVKTVEWLAFSDGRSGDRHHERMNGKTVKLGQLFRLPSGARGRWPMDPRLPVSEIVNCRCTLSPG